MAKPSPKKASEHDHQVALIQWATLNSKKYPELSTLYAVPNAGRHTVAYRVKAKKEGLKSGVPDLCLPVARGKYGSLYIEMKIKGGRLSEMQEIWISRLRYWGNRVEVCYGWEEAVEVLIDYLKEVSK